MYEIGRQLFSKCIVLWKHFKICHFEYWSQTSTCHWLFEKSYFMSFYHLWILWKTFTFYKEKVTQEHHLGVKHFWSMFGPALHYICPNWWQRLYKHAVKAGLWNIKNSLKVCYLFLFISLNICLSCLKCRNDPNICLVGCEIRNIFLMVHLYLMAWNYY